MTDSRKHINLIIGSILLRYLILLMAPTIFSMFLGVSGVGRPVGGTVEILKLREQLSVSLCVGGYTMLTPYCIAYCVIIALPLACRAKKRW